MSDSEFFKKLFEGKLKPIQNDSENEDFGTWLETNDESFEDSFKKSQKEKARKRFRKRMKKED